VNAVVATPTLNASLPPAERGFEIINKVFSHEQCDELANELSILHQRERSKTNAKLSGLRNLLRTLPHVAELASSDRIAQIFNSRLDKRPFPVRALFFDKTPDANWFVSWHQDLTIAVNERIETEGCGCWSVKQGIVHVQPPQSILEGMVALRLHLDDCNAENGALKVVPGSHRRGRLCAAEIANSVNEKGAFICEVPKGSALLMRPLLLHSSSTSKDPSHRRVLQMV
jgi:ectoine hydroxylase-related dioxygenase (phytanoyl-CoA dioxygenase family)